MSFPLRMRWFGSGPGSLERYVVNSSALRRSFEIVTLEAQYAEIVHEVDLLPLNPCPFRPGKVQFLVGHPTASRITIHHDGDVQLVRVPAFTAIPERVSIRDGSGIAPAERGTLMVPTGSVFELVEAICSAATLPGWAELVGRARG